MQDPLAGRFRRQVAYASVALVAPTNTTDFRFGVELPLRDLGDAMQVAAARVCGARYIATRNVRDYRGSPIPARTPAELMQELG